MGLFACRHSISSYFVVLGSKKYGNLRDFLHAGIRLPPILWYFCSQVKYAYLRSSGLIFLSKSLLLFAFPYFLHFWPWPDSKVTSAVGGAALCPTRVLWAFLQKSVECHCFRSLFAPRLQKVCIFMGLCASRPSNAPVLWVSLDQGGRKYTYLHRSLAWVGEDMPSAVSLSLVFFIFPCL